MYVVPIQGTNNPSSVLNIESSVNNGSFTTLMRMERGIGISIGTNTTPGAVIDIKPFTVGGAGLKIQDGSGFSNTWIPYTDGWNYLTGVGTAGTKFRHYNGGYTDDGNIDSSGNLTMVNNVLAGYRIGIGTTSPEGRLHIYETSTNYDGVILQTIETDKTNTINNINKKTYQSEKKTNASTTYETIASYACDTGTYSTYLIKAEITTIDDHNECGAFIIYGTFYDLAGGGAAQVGSTVVAFQERSNAGADVRFNVSTDNILIEVLDDGHVTWWHVTYTVQKTDKEIA
jgi:hypothetical protein